MAAYFITIFLVIVFGIYADSHVYEKLDKNGKLTLFVPKRFLIPLIAVFCIVEGLRFEVGTDFYNYYVSYNVDFAGLVRQFKSLDDPMIYAVTTLSRWIWDNNQFVIFVENAVIILLLFKAFYKFEEYEYTMPLLLFMFYGGWLFSFNAVKQAIAVMIVFAFSNDGGKRGIIKMCVALIVASLFHKSALLMLPVLVLSRRKIDTIQMIMMLGLGYAISNFGEYFYSYMGASELTVGSYATNGINIFRVLVAITPALMIVLLWFMNDNDFLDENRITINMTMINAVICICTRNSSYMNRMSYYTVIYGVFLIPKLGRLFARNSEQIYKIITIVLFFVFFLYEARSIPYSWCLWK